MTGTSWWRKDVFARRLPNLQARTRMLRTMRAFFEREGFQEVETPCLQVSPGLEPHLKAFRTMIEHPQGGPDRALYLHTSPEFAMKKLLVAGVPRLFQFARVFRNGERSDTHHPEFTMLEWYRDGADYQDLIGDCEFLLRDTLNAAGHDRFRWRGREADPSLPFERLTVREAFLRHAGIDLFAVIDDLSAFRAEAGRVGIRTQDDDAWDDVFFRIFLDRIEEKLGIGRPTILMDYPVAMAALSRPKPSDRRVAERFELYVCGLELANAFGELTDPAEQARRFAADMDLKEKLYGERYPIDADFLAALDEGLADCAGIALGFDRLVMLSTHSEKIEDVLWAPVAASSGTLEA